jgi:hypothetical protein
VDPPVLVEDAGRREACLRKNRIGRVFQIVEKLVCLSPRDRRRDERKAERADSKAGGGRLASAWLDYEATPDSENGDAEEAARPPLSSDRAKK